MKKNSNPDNPGKKQNFIRHIFSLLFSNLLNRRSIKFKLNILILFIEISSLLVFSIISINILSTDKLISLKDRMEQANAKLVTDINNDFENMIIRNLNIIENDRIFKDYTESFDVNSLVNLFRKYKDFFYEISFVKNDGREDVRVIDGDIVSDNEYDDYSSNQNFVKLKDNEELKYIPEKEFLIDNIPHIQLFYKCLDKYQDVYAYLSVVFKIDTIIRKVIDQKYEKTGFVFLVNQSGTILFHPDKEKIFRKLSEKGNEASDLVTDIIHSGGKFTRAELNTITGYIQYNPAADFNWSVISIMPLGEFNKPVYNIIFLSVIIIACTIVVSLMMINLILNIIIGPLLNVILKMKDIAEGRILNNEVIKIMPKDEIGILVGAFNQILATLKILVKQANAIADGDLVNQILNEFREQEIAGTGNDQNANITELKAGKERKINTGLKSDVSIAFSKMINNLREIVSIVKTLVINLNSGSIEIETASQEQSNGANEQASGITEVSATLEELSITAMQITKNVSELVHSSEVMINILQENGKLLLMTVEQLNDAGRISKDNSLKITELGKRSELINEMVELIKDVANKTNILSINASLEASKSGETASGFSVIAAEIRALSKETILSAKNAEKAAKEMQKFLDSIIVSSKSESEKVLSGGEIAKGISDKIGNIITQINNNYVFTQKIDISIKQQESGSRQAATTMKQMAEISRQSALTLRETLSAVKDIVKLGTHLEQAIRKFRT